MKLHLEQKTLDERRINIQVGELLPGAPWFYDFLPGVTIQPTITTDWQEFSFKFTVNPLEKRQRWYYTS